MLLPEQILYEDNHLLVVNKPANVVTQGATFGEPSLGELAKQYLKTKYNKPGNVYLGIVSRLDKLTTGVIVLARTSKAAARLTQAFKQRKIQKTYQALVEKVEKVEKSEFPPSLTLTNYIRKNDAARRMEICAENDSRAQLAILHFELAGQYKAATHLNVKLETGRKHQIRLQLAHYGSPVLGDAKYGSQTSFAKGIALHSWKLSLEHPTTRVQLTFEAPLPSEWKSWMQ